MTVGAPSSTVRRGGARDWLGTVLGIGLLIALGVVLGMQYMIPDKRVLAVLAAVLVFGVAWRADMVSGVGVLVLALPYPRGTTFGNTNFALILLLLLIWMLRATHRHAPMPRSTPVDAPIGIVLMFYVLSFYNVQSSHYMLMGISNFLVFLACLALFYLIVNNVRRPDQLERLHFFQVISLSSVCLIAAYELTHPGGSLIPGWIVFQPVGMDEINLHNLRIGGPFFDFELLAEYCAVNLIFVAFLIARARSNARRVLLSGLLLLTTLIMFATVTRGAVFALAIALVYWLFLMRRRVQFVPITLAVGLGALGLQALNFFVATYTHSGDLFKRMMDPQSFRFVGAMPESRAALWVSAFNRALEHPLIGHGPHYVTERGTDFWFWPHNGYLYIAHIIGFVGLGAFLWLLFKLLRMSWVPQPNLGDASYPRAFLGAAHVQLALFMVDQLKIEYLRNPIFQFQIWLLFASIVAAWQIVHRPEPAEPASS